MAKPLEEKKYLAYIQRVGWVLSKGGIDFNLYDENNKYLCTIKVNHSKGKKREVSASSIRKTELEFEERGWLWPPKKKLKNI